MRAKEIATQFERLSPAAQRLVADLIEHLSRPADAVSSWQDVHAPDRPAAAVLLPALNDEEMPITWPENRFMNPHLFGEWADVVDSTEFVRQLRRDQWGAHEAGISG